jgi:hypothetical protein
MADLLPNIVDQHIHPGDEVVKIRYLQRFAGCGQWLLPQDQLYHSGGRTSTLFTSTRPYFLIYKDGVMRAEQRVRKKIHQDANSMPPPEGRKAGRSRYKCALGAMCSTKHKNATRTQIAFALLQSQTHVTLHAIGYGTVVSSAIMVLLAAPAGRAAMGEPPVL